MSTPSPSGNPNKGYLFPNEAKRTDAQPDYRGKITMDGKEFLLSGWKKDKDGREMITISATDPATLPSRPSQSGAPAASSQRSNPAPQRQGPPSPPAGGQSSNQSGGSLDQGFGDIFDNLP